MVVELAGLAGGAYRRRRRDPRGPSNTLGAAKLSFAGGSIDHCRPTVPVVAPKPSTAMRYVVPAVTGKVIFDWFVPLNWSFDASCVSPVMVVPV